MPKTAGGRAATMVYALMGIPLCMMVLAKIGKLLSISLGLIWLYIRRFAQYVKAKGTSKCFKFEEKGKERGQSDAVQNETPVTSPTSAEDTPVVSPTSEQDTSITHLTTAHSPDQPDGHVSEHMQRQISMQSEGRASSVDDMDNASDVTYTGVEENFTPSPAFAIIVLVLYILIGAGMYGQWEKWDYFDSAYFIFVSLTTIGFGDLIPHHPKFFISSSVYIFVGLTLVSLVINTIIDTLKKGMKRAKDAQGVILNRHQMFNLKNQRDSCGEVAIDSPLEHSSDGVQLASIRIPQEAL